MKTESLFFMMFFLFTSQTYAAPREAHLDRIKLPEGFKIEIYADDIPNARQLALGDKGTLFAGSRAEGKVYAIFDRNNDFKADEVVVLAEELNLPSGIAFRDGALYVAEVNKVWRLDGIEEILPRIPARTMVNETFPDKEHHGWKFIGFGPDGKLYVPVGGPCNACESEDEIFASLTRMNPDGSRREVFARGIRNSVGFDWHPETKELWFTDNGRDWLGDDLPPDELNHAPREGMHFGFPYCHGKDFADPEFNKGRGCGEFIPAAQELGAHVAALGMRFYTGQMFPEEYRNQIFIAEHGSWNRGSKIGYRITLVRLKENKPVSYEVFAKGWNQGEEVWGRPADVLVMPDGSLLVADDHAGKIYRISYLQAAPATEAG